MGIKRLNRSRLHNIEKKGIDIVETMGVSSGMKPAIVSATQSREGYKVITDIVVDLGTSKTTIKSGGATDGMALGTLDGSGVAEASYLCKLAPSVFGTVTMVEAVCLEMPSDGTLLGSTANAYELRASADATGKIGAAPAAITLHADLNSIGDAKGKHVSTRAGDGAFAIKTLEDRYLYICCGAGVGGTTTATATITVGSAETDSFTIADVFTDEVNRITLTKHDGVEEHRFFDITGNNHDDAQVASKINAKNAASATITAADIADGIQVAFNGGNSSFTAAHGTSPNLHVVTVTQTGAGVGGNRTNFYADAPGKTLAITVGDFINGSTAGTSAAMTQGKFLIRIEGFMAPADL